MTMSDDDSNSVGAPEWILTFGDMMSLLLTFFIVLVSVGGAQHSEEYEALVASIHSQFDRHASRHSQLPDGLHPRNATLAKITADGRTRIMEQLDEDRSKRK